MSLLSFKSEQIFHNFTNHTMHPELSKLLWWWLDRYYEAVVTSAYRANDKGVHGTLPYFRGLDLRYFIYANPLAMVEDVNRVWIYDPKRPKMKCVILHDVGRGKHFHLQVSYNTEFIGG